MVQKENGSCIPTSRLFFPDCLRALQLSCDWPLSVSLTTQGRVSLTPTSILLASCLPCCSTGGKGYPEPPRPVPLPGSTSPSGRHRWHRRQQQHHLRTLTAFNTKIPAPFPPACCKHRVLLLMFISCFISMCRFLSMFLSANPLVIVSSNSCS